MEPRTRNTWLVVAIVLVVVCCCFAAAGAAIVGWLTDWSYVWGAGPRVERERIERSFAVGNAPTLHIDAQVGNVTVRPGNEGTIQVVAVKKTSARSDLDRVEISFVERAGGLEIRVRLSGPRLLVRNASVDLEIVAPPATRLDLEADLANVDINGFAGGIIAVTRAGNVKVIDVSGPLEVSSDTGVVDIQDAAGPVQVNTKAGLVVYRGIPRGECRFETDIGAIEITLPADPDLEVDAETGLLGNVELRCPVSGQVTDRHVKGVIGSGKEGTIRASSSVGAISITCR